MHGFLRAAMCLSAVVKQFLTLYVSNTQSPGSHAFLGCGDTNNTHTTHALALTPATSEHIVQWGDALGTHDARTVPSPHQTMPGPPSTLDAQSQAVTIHSHRLQRFRHTHTHTHTYTPVAFRRWGSLYFLLPLPHRQLLGAEHPCGIPAQIHRQAHTHTHTCLYETRPEPAHNTPGCIMTQVRALLARLSVWRAGVSAWHTVRNMTYPFCLPSFFVYTGMRASWTWEPLLTTCECT